MYRETNVPDQAGKTALVTGANTGIGLETARILAARGAQVLLGCRDQAKADEAMGKIREHAPDAELEWIELDLASLASIEKAAEKVSSKPKLDLLINNAGVMIPPKSLTDDGFELQFGVNHLGHFALTGRLLGKLINNEGARIVNVSSLAHRNGRINYDDINAQKQYNRMDRYAMSKFANLLFTYELQRKLSAADASAIAVACHPGGSNTDLGRHFPTILQFVFLPLQLLMNSAAEGALPTLMAATEDRVEGGDYYGPAGMGEFARSARKVDTVPRAKDENDATRLWHLSEEMTGITFSFS
ncbi:MAG: oxidoreductase [Pseudomonadota bacterium]